MKFQVTFWWEGRWKIKNKFFLFKTAWARATSSSLVLVSDSEACFEQAISAVLCIFIIIYICEGMRVMTTNFCVACTPEVLSVFKMFKIVQANRMRAQKPVSASKHWTEASSASSARGRCSSLSLSFSLKATCFTLNYHANIWPDSCLCEGTKMMSKV